MARQTVSARFSKIRILFLWTLFFLVLFFIAIFVSWLIYSRAVSSIEKEVEQSYTLELGRIKYLIDEKLNEMKRIGLEQSLNTDMQQLLQMKTVTPESRIILWQIQQRLKVYCVSNAYISDIVIGFNDADIAISNKSIYSIKEVSDVILDGSLIQELQSRVYKNKFILLKKKQPNDKSIPQVVYLLSLPLISGSSNNSFVLITMNTDTLAQLLPVYDSRIVSMALSNDAIYLENDQIIESSDKQINFDSFRLYTADSNIENIRYCYYISNNEFFSKITGINNVTIISLILCVLLFTSILILFIRMNYNPIHRISVKINEHFKSRISPKNELAYIEGSLTDLFSERQDLIGVLEKQRYALKNYFILRLIKGEMDFESGMSDYYQKYGLSFKHGCFIVVVTKLKNYGSLSNDVKDPADSLNLAQLLIIKTYYELPEESYEINSINVDDNIVTLINFEERMLADLHENLLNLGTALKSLFNIDVSIAVSQPASALSDISRAYGQAREAIEYCLLLDKNYSIYTKGHTNNNTNDSKLISNINKRLSNCIAVGDFGSVIMMIDEVFNAYFSEVYSVSTIKLNIYGLIHVIFSSLNDFATAQCYPLDTDSIIYNLLNCKSINALKASLENEFSNISYAYKAYLGNQTNDLIDKIMEYIDVNYSSYDLSVGRIADEFKVSVPYLSKVFKRITSVNLLDYIHNVRIKKAKDILDTFKYNINEVATMVGFIDSSSFIKVFKKLEGIPPGKYSRQNGELLSR